MSAARRRVAAAALLAFAPAAILPLGRLVAQQNPTPAAAPPASDARNPLAVPSRTPPVRVYLSQEALVAGDRVQVHARARADGYLLVLQADPAGRLRVLFPLDPGDQQRVKGGAEMALPTRSGRASFVAATATGDGAVLAAVSASPFRVADFARGGHWNVRAFPRAASGADPEGELVALADRMSVGRFDYDLAPYRVSQAIPVVAYGRAAYGGDDYEQQESAGAMSGGYSTGGLYYYEDIYGYYGLPFFGGVYPVPYWPGFYSPYYGRGRHFSPCYVSPHTGLSVVIGPGGCSAAGFGRRPRVPGRGRTGGEFGDQRMVGNPDFSGAVRPFGTRSTGPRAVAGSGRAGVPPSPNAGGTVFRMGSGMTGVPARPLGGAAPTVRAPAPPPPSPRIP